MRRFLLLTSLAGLAGASPTFAAAEATWAAVGTLEDRLSPYCGGGTVGMPEWVGRADGQVDIKGNTLTFRSASPIPNHSFTVDLKGLQPDGSGTVAAKDTKNRTFYLTFDRGSGARPFHMTYSYNACRRDYTPKA
jgi:hypothetical protein